MKSRTCRSLLLVWFVQLIGVGAVQGEIQVAEEPIYAGKPLSAWVDEVVAVGRLAWVVTTNRAEVQAVHAIGTNAIPWLLSEMRKQPSPGWVGSTNFHQLRARNGFWALGETGAPAISMLLELLEQQPEFVPSALAGIGAPALPALHQCLTNAPHYVPPYLLSQIPRERAVASALGGLFVAIDSGRISKSDAAFLLPTVRLWAKDTNKDAAYWASGVLRKLGAED